MYILMDREGSEEKAVRPDRRVPYRNKSRFFKNNKTKLQPVALNPILILDALFTETNIILNKI